MPLPWLTHEALFRNWEHVRNNGGCAGADGITIERFASDLDAELNTLIKQVEGGDYRSLPLLPIEVEKKPESGGTRTLLVPSVRDRVLQTCVGRQLGSAFEDEFLECSFAYRPHRSVNSAIARIRYLRDHGYRFAVKEDIENFFDRIDHPLLRKRIATGVRDTRIVTLIDQWITGPVWNGTNINPLQRGIPQGSPISPLLANLFLTDFDIAIQEAGLKLIRYADDFLILSKEEDQANPAMTISERELEKLNLRLKDQKTEIRTFEEGFRFLGALFLGNDVWIPWEKHQLHTRVLSVPKPMPPTLVQRWLEPPRLTAMSAALAGAGVAVIAERQPEEDKDDNMAYLYLVEQGSIVRKIGNRIVIEKDGAILLDRPYHKLEAVLLFGNIQITTQAMSELLDNGVRLDLLSRRGDLRGALTPSLGKNVPLRIAQFELHRDSVRSLAMARSIVDAKLANSAQVLETFGDRTEARGPVTETALAEIQRARESATTAATLEVLNGIEGSAARLYFDTLMRRNKSAFSWPGRARHPATDPINSLLSFAYTLVANELAGLTEALGLDSYLGSLHQLDYGRRSLSLDLVELFRAPLVDRLVLTICNRRQFDAADFEPVEEGALHLRPESSKRFLAEYERWMLHAPLGSAGEGFRPVLRKTVESYAVAVRDGAAFVPFLYAPSAEQQESSNKASS
jgi:CRISPR-associated protein Cas1